MTRLVALATAIALAGCYPALVTNDDNEGEVITTVTLTFTPDGGGTPVTASFDDPDGDGGELPVIDPIVLTAGTTYDLAVQFINRREEPAEDITLEVRDESDEHQVFFTGSAVDGPASDHPDGPLVQTYADLDVNGLPIGLDNQIVARTGTGMLTVTLRHLPPLNGQPAKTAELADAVKAGGFAGLAGETDAQVPFDVTVP
ncbi:MAG TPA: hypothetical protein VFQ53_00745 [Kofleriaceae bacterium]|nr:hypothetical protein [Kofleriaceae bacterium]